MSKRTTTLHDHELAHLTQTTVTFWADSRPITFKWTRRQSPDTWAIPTPAPPPAEFPPITHHDICTYRPSRKTAKPKRRAK